MSEARFAVLLARAELLRDPRLAQALATRLKMPFADAARRATTAWGIVGEGLAEAEARGLAEALGAAGLDSFARPEAELPVLAPARKVSAAAFAPGGLQLAAEGGAAELPHAEFSVLAAAAYHVETSKMVTVKEGPTQAQKMASLALKLGTGLPINIGGKEREVRKEEKTRELVLRLELVTRAGALRFRIDAESFNYNCLGSKMEYGTHLNFRSLLEALRERLPGARLNRGAGILLARQAVGTMGYDRQEDLERELRWLLALQ